MITQPQARVLLDSYFIDRGKMRRVMTMIVVIHRFILAEFNTHRDFSRNSSSSRAIPAKKQLASVTERPALPLEWPREQRGMQGGELLSEGEITQCLELWNEHLHHATWTAQRLTDLGLHKSVVNRLLEPFMWQTIVMTSTEFDNFWHQRNSKLAQPEFRVAAAAMKEAFDASTPTLLREGEWHLPFVTDHDREQLIEEYGDSPLGLQVAKLCSASRAARVSYLSHESQVRDVARDLERAAFLANPGDGPPHFSPFEHVCRPMTLEEIKSKRQRGNLRYWHQMRADVEDETGLAVFDRSIE